MLVGVRPPVCCGGCGAIILDGMNCGARAAVLLLLSSVGVVLVSASVDDAEVAESSGRLNSDFSRLSVASIAADCVLALFVPFLPPRRLLRGTHVCCII